MRLRRPTAMVHMRKRPGDRRGIATGPGRCVLAESELVHGTGAQAGDQGRFRIKGGVFPFVGADL